MRKLLVCLTMLGFILVACDAGDDKPDPTPDTVDVPDIATGQDEVSPDDVVDVPDSTKDVLEDIPDVLVDPDKIEPGDVDGGGMDPDVEVVEPDIDVIDDTDSSVCIEDDDCEQPEELCEEAICLGGGCFIRAKDCWPDDYDPSDEWYCNPDTGSCEVCVGCHVTLHPCADPNHELYRPDYCDDGDICTDDICHEQEGCSYVGNTLGCDDGNMCTVGDVCGPDPWENFPAVCLGAERVSCDDGEECTYDYCLPDQGCRHLQLPEPCDAIECDADLDCPQVGDLCAIYECDQTAGVCVINELDGDDCDDGSACTVGDRCVDGFCEPGATIDCDDGDPCTADRCEPDTGCISIPLDPCPFPCEEEQDCLEEFGSDTLNDPCRAWVCTARPDDPGICVLLDVEGPCDDGDSCTVNDRCIEGICGGQTNSGCNDDDPCTIDSCDQNLGCVNQPIGPWCEPRACTTGLDCLDADTSYLQNRCYLPSCFVMPDGESICFFGLDSYCLCGGPGDDAVCDDGDACTIDQCVANDDENRPDPAYYCKHQYDQVSCCSEACVDSNGCSDEDKCTSDYCNIPEGSVSGCCINPALPPPCGVLCDDDGDCDTGDPLTESLCNPNDGTCDPTSPINCGEFPCTRDEDCATNAAFSDGNPCTDPVCVGCSCQHIPSSKPCSDNDACTELDVCLGGECVGADVVCPEPDNPSCFRAICDPLDGCGREWDPVPGECSLVCESDPSVCDDGNPCTIDTCAPDGGCINESVNEGGEHLLCLAMPCEQFTDCDDGNPCTDDRCQTEIGEVSLPLSERSCLYSLLPGCEAEPDLACIGAEDCASPLPCDADTEEACCASDPFGLRAPARCEPDVGCRWVPLVNCRGACNIPNQGEDCNDRDPCTVDICDPVTLRCDNSLPAWSPSENLLGGCIRCDDSIDCNEFVDEANPCMTAECVPTPNPSEDAPAGDGFCLASVNEMLHPMGCDDFDPCTLDICSLEGCTHEAIGDNCGFCTTGQDCSDGDTCTSDSCGGAGVGCSHADIADCIADECITAEDCPGDECELQKCSYGECVPVFNRDDGIPPYCAPAGCLTASDCDDGDMRTTDLCTLDDGMCVWMVENANANTCETDEDCERIDAWGGHVPCRELLGCDAGMCLWQPEESCAATPCDSNNECDQSACGFSVCVASFYGTGCMRLVDENESEDLFCCENANDCDAYASDVTGMNAAASPVCTDIGICDYVGYPADFLVGNACESAADCFGNCPGVDPLTNPHSIWMQATSECVDWPCAEAMCTTEGRCVYLRNDCDICADDSTCMDDDPCTEDLCVGGECSNDLISGCTVTPCSVDNRCESNVPCTMGVCVPAVGCFWSPIEGCD